MELLRLENAKLRELVFQNVPDAARLYPLDHRALEGARAASERAPDNEKLRVTAEALQNKAAAVSRGRDERRDVHHLPADIQLSWYYAEVTNGCRNPHGRPSYAPERPGFFPIVDAVGLH